MAMAMACGPAMVSQGTTVIAVRGTLNALDVLHDVTLWLVPTVLQRLGSRGNEWGMKR